MFSCLRRGLSTWKDIVVHVTAGCQTRGENSAVSMCHYTHEVQL